MEGNEGWKDPVKHSQASLEAFVESAKEEFGGNHWFSSPQQYLPLNNPTKHNANGSTGDAHKDRLVLLIKAGQRQSNDWKNSWAEWTTSQLNSVRDPAAHDAITLQRFIDTHKDPFMTADWFNRPEDFAPKPRTNNPNNNLNQNNSFMGSSAGGFQPVMPGNPGPFSAINLTMNPMIHNNWYMMKESTGPAPNDLVNMIKDGQRTNQHFKEQWGSFCDTYCDGIRDPHRHPAANIIQFCEMMGIMPNRQPHMMTQIGNNPAANAMTNRFRPY